MFFLSAGAKPDLGVLEEVLSKLRGQWFWQDLKRIFLYSCSVELIVVFMERVPTGIHGLDEMIEGGFPKGRTVLVSGGAGTGKSIFSLQYLYHGAKEHDEPGVYVTVDEDPKMIRKDLLRFGWDLRELENQNKLVMLDLTGSKTGMDSEEEFSISAENLSFDKMVLKIMQTAERIGAKRLVIDSIPAFGFRMENENKIRSLILKLSYLVRRSGLTSIFISEIPEQGLGQGPMTFSKYGVEEYVADSVILLNYMGVGTQANRTLYIRKMRGTKHVEDIIPLHITESGIKLTNPEAVFDED